VSRDVIGTIFTIALVEYLCWHNITHSTTGNAIGMACAVGFMGYFVWGVLSAFLPDTAADRERKRKVAAYWKQREEEEQREQQRQKESQQRMEEDEKRREEADLKRKEQIQIRKFDPRIAKLQAFLAPKSGATANERNIARQKIKEIEETGGGAYSDVYTMGELRAHFKVLGARHIISTSGDRSIWTTQFIVRRKSDGQMGSLESQDRFFFNFKEDSWIRRAAFGPECNDDCRRGAYVLNIDTLVPHDREHWCRQSK
jgi:hypothetical protein